MKRWLWIIVLAAIAAVGIFLGFRPQPVPVETAKVTRGPLRVTVEEEGKTRLRSRYVISAPVSGVMPRLKWKAGDTIRAGELITALNPPPPVVLDARTKDTAAARVKTAEAAQAVAVARVRAMEEQVRVARNDLDFWRRQRERDEKLRQTGDIPADRVDRNQTELTRVEAAIAAAERNVATARAEVESTKAEVDAARTMLRMTTSGAATGERISIVAPTGGRVIKVIRESEGPVAAAEPLLEIGDAQALEVIVDLLSADAVRVQPGTRVLLTRWGGEATLEARVRVIEPGGFTKISALGVEEQRVRVVSDLVTPATEWKALGDGYRVEAAFVLWESPSVLQVPASTLFRVQDQWAVFAVDAQGFARRRTLQLGHRNALAAEVLSGLEENADAVTHPDETVKDGVMVKK